LPSLTPKPGPSLKSVEDLHEKNPRKVNENGAVLLPFFPWSPTCVEAMAAWVPVGSQLLVTTEVRLSFGALENHPGNHGIWDVIL